MKLLVIFVAAALFAAEPATKLPQVKFTDTRLGNGLRVIISEDRYAPVFSIAVSYNVGSRDERRGRTGFAHLFEHMMFKGSEKVGPGEHFVSIFNNGGNMNGTTNTDRTVYYETLPKNQLDLALFLESDRMRSLAITKENLDNQRNAVQEERRLAVDNRPYGVSREKQSELAYDNFAYKHSVIGSMEDLNAATIADVRDFFKTYYAPNNAVVALVGDLNTADVLVRMKKYFGDIGKQEPPKPVDMTEPPQDAERRLKLDDKLARLAQVSMVYKIPAAAHADAAALAMMARIIGGGESSRLYQKLVKEKEVATSVGAFAEQRAGPGLLHIVATVRPGKSPEEVEGLISEEVSRLHGAPVTPDELTRARAAVKRAAVSAHESSLMRALRMADDAVLYNDPGRMNTFPQKQLGATAGDIERVAKAYLRTANRTVVTTVPPAREQKK